MDPVDVVAIVVGLVVVGAAFLDAFDTLLATNIRALRWSLTGGYYRVAWRSYRWVCTHVRAGGRKDRALALFGPASFIGLLALWTVAARLITFLAERTGLDPDPYERLPSRYWSIGYTAISRLGCATVPFDESLGRLHELREPFHPLMEAFIDELLAPRGFWGVTAADHLAPTSLGELFGDDEP